MEIVDSYAKREDRNLLVVTHLTQLLYYITGFGGLVVPLILWLTQRDKVIGMDEHGKAIVNFQITLLIIALVSIPAILLLGIGLLGLLYVGIVGFILPIVNAIRASNGQGPSYFGTFRILQ